MNSVLRTTAEARALRPPKPDPPPPPVRQLWSGALLRWVRLRPVRCSRVRRFMLLLDVVTHPEGW